MNGVEMHKDIESEQVFKSKWGYHPVSYEDYLILKAIHKRFWESLKGAYRWQSWNRKKSGNRTLTEPKLDLAFVKKEPSFMLTKMVDGYARMHLLDFTTTFKLISLYCFRSNRLDIIRDFRNARLPCNDPKDVQPLNMVPYRDFFYKEMVLGCEFTRYVSIPFDPFCEFGEK